MNKKLKVLSLAAVAMLAACSDTSLTSTITSGTQQETTQIEFWGWGNEEEVRIFRGLVEKFNRENTDGIVVNYVQKSSDSYSTAAEQALAGRRGPDLFYVSDECFKKWVHLDYLRPITDFVAETTNPDVDLTDMWPKALERYRYNKDTETQLETDDLYCLPKDIGPSVIYYNADALREVGITIISVDAENAKASQKHGYNTETKTFNNKIAMTWEEQLEMSKLLTQRYNPDSPTEYGYYTNWWFNYGWSIGGDCIKRNEETGKFEFTLGDTTTHDDGKGHTLPSMRDAFKFFVELSTVHEVCPKPTTVTTANVFNYFESGKIAMFTEVRAAVPELRANASFDWDVAPLPVHQYGIKAGHSGSVGFGINKKCTEKRAQAAYKAMEFFGGKTGQAEQALSGMNVPNQMSTSRTETFLQSDKKPRNSEIFLDAITYQRGGDWTYLSDKAWINVWADRLNGDVLNGLLSVDDFFDLYTGPTNEMLANNY